MRLTLRFLSLAALLIGSLCACNVAVAGTIVSHAADFEPRFRTGGTITPAGPYDPGPSVTATSLRVGFQANFEITAGYFFQLPVLVPGESLVGASFSVAELPDSAAGAVTPTHNADLVAVGFTNLVPPGNSAAESASYFYLGEGASDPNGIQIQDNFLMPADFIPLGGTSAIKSTNNAGNSALLSYISDLYANQATNGFIPGTSQLILRVNPDLTAGAGTNRYTLASAETTVALQPTLSLATETIPEPSAAALLVVGTVGVSGKRLWRARRGRNLAR